MAKRNSSGNRNYRQQASSIKKKITLLCWLGTIALVTFVVGKHLTQQTIASNTPSQQVTAQTDVQKLQLIDIPNNLDNKTIHYEAYTAYFNPSRHEPNATVYELTAEETDGDQPRHSNFMQDDEVSGCPKPRDYSNSGYDRGHMTPAGDMKWSEQAMRESFFMTNICPQLHSLNSNGWSRLEKKVRAWAKRDSSLIVITGPIFEGKGQKTIGKEVRIPVPDKFFKVIYAPRQHRAIAFVYPNDSSAGSKARKYAVTARQVEQLTGLNFFCSLSSEEQDDIENQCDYTQWDTSRK